MSWMDNPIPETENNEAGRLAFVKRIAEQWAEPWKSAGLWVKEGTKIPIDSGPIGSEQHHGIAGMAR